MGRMEKFEISQQENWKNEKTRKNGKTQKKIERKKQMKNEEGNKMQKIPTKNTWKMKKRTLDENARKAMTIAKD